MKYRELGRTGWKVSEISFGAWAIGGAEWGNVTEKDALDALNKAIDLGVNFIDTADVYGDGRSEKIISKLLKERSEEIIVATKAGRRLNPHDASGYNKKNLTAFVERSLQNLQKDCLDLVQLHCPPTEVYYMPEVFQAMDELVAEGKIKYYGVSVEKVEEAIKAIEYPNVQTVQIIFNMFRLRPNELFFDLAKKKEIGILARVPLASGLLTGKISFDTKFVETDHRNFNINGEAFDKGETFSGVNLADGIKAVKELEKIKPDDLAPSQFALKWITMFDAVTCAIPGAKNLTQVNSNFSVSELSDISEKTMSEISEIYQKYIKASIHQKW